MRRLFLRLIARPSAWTLLLAAALATTTLVSVALVSTARGQSATQAAPAADAPAASHQASQAGNQDSFIDNKTASSQNLAKAEQEDEEYVFKHSPSVRAVARWFHLSPDAAAMVFWALNAILLFVVVGYFLVTGLPKAFRSRRQQLERELVQARTSTEQAHERLRVVEERLGRLDGEIDAIRAQAEHDSVHDEARIKEGLEQEKQKIVASAESEIAAAGGAAERSLRSFAAELAVNRATARLRLTEDDDRSLIREFAAGLGGDGSKGGRN